MNKNHYTRLKKLNKLNIFNKTKINTSSFKTKQRLANWHFITKFFLPFLLFLKPMQFIKKHINNIINTFKSFNYIAKLFLLCLLSITSLALAPNILHAKINEVFSNVNANNITILEQRLLDEQKLYHVSQDLYDHIKQETSNVLYKIKTDTEYKFKAPNYILEQFRLQANKTSLQAQRINIDRDTISQELLATDNAIYQLESKLQSLLGPSKRAFIKSDESVGLDIKKLQKDINYHKTVLEINNKRLKILNNHYELVQKIQLTEENFLSDLQVIIIDYNKKLSLSELNKKELAINKQVEELLEQELIYKNQIRKLDIESLENNTALIRYNQLYISILDSVNKRGVLELDLGILRLDSRFSEITSLFESSNNEILQNKKNLSGRLDRLQKESLSLKHIANKKLDFINAYKSFIDKERQVKNISLDDYNKTVKLLDNYSNSYNEYIKTITATVNKLNTYISRLNDLYLKDISVRQTLPDGWAEWQVLFADFFTIPYLLSRQIMVSWLQLQNYFFVETALKVLKIFMLEFIVLGVIILFFKLVAFIRQKYYKATLDRLSKLAFYILGNFLHRDRYIIAVIFNIITLFWFTDITGVIINIFILISILYLLIRFVLSVCYIFLIQNTLEISGDDSRLYKGLKYSLYFGTALFALMILAKSLNLSISTLGFIDRLFMLFLVTMSYPLITNWHVVPQLIIDGLDPKPYIRRAIWLLSIIVPVTILSNAALGIIGYVNLAWQIAVAEFQLSLVITFWLLIKGLFSEAMEGVSRFFIRNVTNGWLWTESVLKPLHTVINFLLFISAILGLVVIYGWNRNIELFSFISTMKDYHLFSLPGEVPGQYIEVLVSDFIIFCIIFALVIWATKWSREFSYRWLYSRTKDLAVRNSFSVFTQYTTLLVGIIIILKVLGIPTSTLMVSVGGLLLFLGFGLRDIISNYISGIILLIERQVRTGDYVTVGEFDGKVTKIGVRSLTVESFDNMEVIVPNTDTITKPLINWTYKDTVIRMELDLRLSYEEDLDRVRNLIVDAIKQNESVLEEPMPKVHLREFSDSAIVARIYYFIDLNKTPGRSSIRTKVIMAITQVMTEHGINVAYPKQLVDIGKSSS